jgi:hypothetical protein
MPLVVVTKLYKEATMIVPSNDLFFGVEKISPFRVKFLRKT